MRLSRQWICDVCELHFVWYVSQLNARFVLIILPIWYFVCVCNFVSQLEGGIRFVRCISQLNTRCCLLLCWLFGWEFGLSTWKQNTLWEQVLRRKFEPTVEEVIWGLRKLHNEKFHYSYSSPNSTSMIISRGIRWTGHVARMGDKVDKHRPICSFWSQWNTMRGRGQKWEIFRAP